MKNKIEITEHEYELLNRTKALLNRKKSNRIIVSGNYKKTKEDLLKSPTLQNFFNQIKKNLNIK